jgi:hypothetical protein
MVYDYSGMGNGNLSLISIQLSWLTGLEGSINFFPT